MCVVYLSNGTSTLCGTLFSPDAEKLINYTAAELKASDENNVYLVKEIGFGMHKKEVLCFLKCLDRTFQGNNVRTYLVVKMYLQSELTSDGSKNADSVGDSEGGSSSRDVAMVSLVLPCNQFFSPATKKVLEEIHDAPAKNTPAVQSASVKMPLVFVSTTTQPCHAASTKESAGAVYAEEIVDTPTSSVEQPAEPVPANFGVTKTRNESTSKNQSPVKKIKNNED